VFPKKGNQAYAHADSVLVVKFKQTPDNNFKREGNDLIFTYKMTLEDALKSEPIRVKTLDGRVLSFIVDGIISPQTVHVIKGEGMPIRDESDKVS
jgi:DnaJ-class molecular chaperone